jgi:hypothetical protein
MDDFLLPFNGDRLVEVHLALISPRSGLVVELSRVNKRRCGADVVGRLGFCALIFGECLERRPSGFVEAALHLEFVVDVFTGLRGGLVRKDVSSGLVTRDRRRLPTLESAVSLGLLLLFGFEAHRAFALPEIMSRPSFLIDKRSDVDALTVRFEGCEVRVPFKRSKANWEEAAFLEAVGVHLALEPPSLGRSLREKSPLRLGADPVVRRLKFDIVLGAFLRF